MVTIFSGCLSPNHLPLVSIDGSGCGTHKAEDKGDAGVMRNKANSYSCISRTSCTSGGGSRRRNETISYDQRVGRKKGCLVSTSGEALCAHTMQRDCWGRGGHTLQPMNTVLHLPCSVNVRPVTIAQSSSHLDAWAHPASLINVGPATWTLCVQPDWRFSLTVLVVAFSSSGFVFLVLCPATIDGFGRRRSTYDGGSSGRGRRKYM